LRSMMTFGRSRCDSSLAAMKSGVLARVIRALAHARTRCNSRSSSRASRSQGSPFSRPMT
jgi:hypothetical protein